MSRSTIAAIIFWTWVISVGVTWGAGFWAGQKYQRNADEDEKLAAVTRAIEQANDVAEQDLWIATSTENRLQANAATFDRIQEETRRHVQNHPEYFACGLDADGLRLWNAANAGHIEDAPGQPDGGVSGRAVGIEWQAAGPGRQPQGSDAQLPRLQGPAPGTGGVGEEGGE